MMKHVLAIVAVLSFAVAVQAGVTLSVAVGVNSAGDDIYTITATSDAGPITSLGIMAESAGGNLGQNHPAGFDTALGDYNAFFGGTPVDVDTQALFETAADTLLVVSGSSDTANLLDVNFTGFAPFQSRAIAQIVLTGGEGVATIGVVADGELTTAIPTAQGAKSALTPEPASLSLLAIGGLMMIRRR